MIFGPTLIRPKHDHGMQAMMDDHSYQCKVCTQFWLCSAFIGRLTALALKVAEAMIQQYTAIFETVAVDRLMMLHVPSSAPTLTLDRMWFACYQRFDGVMNRIRIAASVPLRKSRIAEQDSGMVKTLEAQSHMEGTFLILPSRLLQYGLPSACLCPSWRRRAAQAR